jgi:LysM repeat protein
MYGRALRNLLILALVIAVFAAVAFFIYIGDQREKTEIYYNQVTISIETAIANALFAATRTAEAPLEQYRLITLDADDTLAQIAQTYRTTVEVLRMVNGLAPDVQSGAGVQIIVPEGVQELDPPRRLELHEALPGETLNSLAQRLRIPIEVLEMDNPVLARRGVNPGDIIFIPILL